MLNPDFRDMLFALSDADAEFLVVGAFAMAAHGAPRSTGDIDLWVRPTAENARKVWQAMIAFEAPMSNWSIKDFEDPDLVFQIGVRPCRIDILCSLDGVSFEEAWQHRVFIDVEGRRIPVLGRDDLLKNKRATGRDKDLLDVKLLERNPPRAK